MRHNCRQHEAEVEGSADTAPRTVKGTEAACRMLCGPLIAQGKAGMLGNHIQENMTKKVQGADQMGRRSIAGAMDHLIIHNSRENHLDTANDQYAMKE